MARIETLNAAATAKIAAIAATKFKGVRNRPANNSMNECALVAAKLAWKHGCDYFVIPAAYGMAISPAKDAENTYRDFGHGVRLTAKGELFANPLAA